MQASKSITLAPARAAWQRPPRGSSQRLHGFTLIELMIVVAIVAILAAVALPAYQGTVTKTWRTKAAGCLTELAQGMERRFTSTLSYAGPAATPDVLPPNSCTLDDDMPARYTFNFAATPGTAANPGFTLRAVPQGAQATRDTLCATLSIDQTGLRGQTGTGTQDLCW